MEMTQKIVVLYAGQYAMVDEKTKQKNEGISVSYLYGDNLNSNLNPNGSLGQRPAKASLSPVCWASLTNVPGLYNGIFQMSIGSDGKPTLRLIDVQYESRVALTPVKESH